MHLVPLTTTSITCHPLPPPTSPYTIVIANIQHSPPYLWFTTLHHFHHCLAPSIFLSIHKLSTTIVQNTLNHCRYLPHHRHCCSTLMFTTTTVRPLYGWHRCPSPSTINIVWYSPPSLPHNTWKLLSSPHDILYIFFYSTPSTTAPSTISPPSIVAQHLPLPTLPDTFHHCHSTLFIVAIV